ncbi:MAG: DUF1360 domain-containing protein [Acidimicrobiales bacterium]
MSGAGDEPYSAGEDRPLGGFAGLMGVYAVAVAVGSLVVRRRGGLPERLRTDDLALVSVATHKISRLLAKDPVTSPLRAPFTRFAGTTGPAELKEEVKGIGAQKAMGELVTCPFCLGQWVATALVFGLAIAPRATRMVAATFTVVTAADLLQFAYSAAEKTE